MDSEDENQTTHPQRYEDDHDYLSNMRSQFSNLQRGKTKGNSSSEPAFKTIGIITLSLFIVLIAATFIYKFNQMGKKIIALEQSILKESTSQKPGLDFKVIADDYEQRIRNLERKLLKLELNSVQPRKSQEKTTAKQVKQAKLNSKNQSALIPYFQKQFQNHKITINFLHEHERQTYYYQKVDFLRSCSGSDFLRGYGKAKDSFMQAINNFKLPHFNIHIQRQRDDLEKKDYDRLSREYDFNLPEIPFCIVVPTINNARNFRYQYNLQSMVSLNYKNFKIVIIDDGSTDNTYELILQWIEDNGITHDIVVIKNQKRLTAVPNIYTAVTKYCSPNDIVVLVDGDDEMLGKNAFKVFNHLYQKNNADVVYSNHLQFYTHTRQVYRGWSMSYSDEEKRNNRYRDVPQRIAHLRSFKASLFLKIKEEDLKDKNGEWFTSTYDEVICLPILEMSCGKIVYVEEFFYLYNFGIGTNDLQVDQGLQKSIADEVKYKRKKYQCLKQ